MSAWNWKAPCVGALAATLVLATAGVSSATRRPPAETLCHTLRCTAAPIPALHIELVSAWDCGGVLLAIYNQELLRGIEWQPMQDDGAVAMQLHFVGNGLGQGGAWESIDSVSGGEGRLRHDLRTGGVPTYDESMRVQRTDGTGLTSSAKQVTLGCPPV